MEVATNLVTGQEYDGFFLIFILSDLLWRIFLSLSYISSLFCFITVSLIFIALFKNLSPLTRI